MGLNKNEEKAVKEIKGVEKYQKIIDFIDKIDVSILKRYIQSLDTLNELKRVLTKIQTDKVLFENYEHHASQRLKVSDTRRLELVREQREKIDSFRKEILQEEDPNGLFAKVIQTGLSIDEFFIEKHQMVVSLYDEKNIAILPFKENIIRIIETAAAHRFDSGSFRGQEVAKSLLEPIIRIQERKTQC